jgi:hypothetical protein
MEASLNASMKESVEKSQRDYQNTQQDIFRQLQVLTETVSSISERLGEPDTRPSPAEQPRVEDMSNAVEGTSNKTKMAEEFERGNYSAGIEIVCLQGIVLIIVGCFR